MALRYMDMIFCLLSWVFWRLNYFFGLRGVITFSVFTSFPASAFRLLNCICFLGGSLNWFELDVSERRSLFKQSSDVFGVILKEPVYDLQQSLIFFDFFSGSPVVPNCSLADCLSFDMLSRSRIMFKYILLTSTIVRMPGNPHILLVVLLQEPCTRRTGAFGHIMFIQDRVSWLCLIGVVLRFFHNHWLCLECIGSVTFLFCFLSTDAG